MADPQGSVRGTIAQRRNHIFPTLTPPQLTRIRAHGRIRHVRAGEVLIEEGETVVPFFVVTAGRVSIVRPSGSAETPIVVHGPGEFTGEANMISGRRALFRAQALEDGEVVELTREHLLTLVQTDAELSEILMRAFLLRRVELVAAGLGDVLLIGSPHSSATLPPT